MVAVASLIVGLFLARFLTSLKTVVLTQAALLVLASAVTVATSPNYGASQAQGLELSAALVPLTVLVVLLGRFWRTRAGATSPDVR